MADNTGKRVMRDPIRDSFYALDDSPGIYFLDSLGRVWEVTSVTVERGMLAEVDALPVGVSRVDEPNLEPAYADFCRQVRAAVEKTYRG